MALRLSILGLLLLTTVLAGCAADDPPPSETGPGCALFDPVPPAATVALSLDATREPPANTSFVLEVSRVDGEGRPGEPFHRVRFPENGCAGVGLANQGPGTYWFWAEAPHPGDRHCSWFDGAETEVPADGLAQVVLRPALACT